MAPQLACLPWLATFAYSTLSLATWILWSNQNGAAQTGWLGLAVLLALWCSALDMMYRREREARCEFVARHFRCATPRRLRALPDACSPLLEFILPAAWFVCSACLPPPTFAK